MFLTQKTALSHEVSIRQVLSTDRIMASFPDWGLSHSTKPVCHVAWELKGYPEKCDWTSAIYQSFLWNLCWNVPVLLKRIQKVVNSFCWTKSESLNITASLFIQCFLNIKLTTWHIINKKNWLSLNFKGKQKSMFWSYEVNRVNKK